MPYLKEEDHILSIFFVIASYECNYFPWFRHGFDKRHGNVITT